MSGKLKDFHVSIPLPVECSGFRPVFLVHAVRYGTFQQYTVSGIRTWQIMEFIQLVNRFEVDNQIERNCTYIILRVPVISGFCKVEQAVHTGSALCSLPLILLQCPE